MSIFSCMYFITNYVMHVKIIDLNKLFYYFKFWFFYAQSIVLPCVFLLVADSGLFVQRGGHF